MAGPVWIEVALNGPWSRRFQPNVPLSVEEIVADGIACAQAGATIIHVHARNAETGRPDDDPDIYAAIIEGIRAQEDVIVYPTIPIAGGPDSPNLGSGEERYGHIRALAERGLLEWSVADPGSVNLVHERDLEKGRDGFVYLNPVAHLRTALTLAAEYGFHPSYAIYEPGFARLGAALAREYPGLPVPIYRLMFADGYRFGFAPRTSALEAYLDLLEEEASGAPWMIAGLSVDVRPLIPTAVARGGHVRVGLEDAGPGETRRNAALVEEAAALIGQAGGEVATIADVRQALHT